MKQNNQDISHAWLHGFKLLASLAFLCLCFACNSTQKRSSTGPVSPAPAPVSNANTSNDQNKSNNGNDQNNNHKHKASLADTCTQALVTTDKFPFLDFISMPANNQKAIALTFDDGPRDQDPSNSGDTDMSNTTDQVLQILQTFNLKVTFFINTDNWVDVAGSTLQSSAAQNSLMNIYKQGHTIANHTVHHWHLNGDTSYLDKTNPHYNPSDPNAFPKSAAVVDSELSGVETTVANVLHMPLAITLIRAPFGEPYPVPEGYFQSLQSDPNVIQTQNVIAQHGVHIAWSFDSLDSKDCADAMGTIINPNATQLAIGANCIIDNMKNIQGNWGTVLLHASLPHTVAALPTVIKNLQDQGYQFVSVESLVEAKYGLDSLTLNQCYTQGFLPAKSH